MEFKAFNSRLQTHIAEMAIGETHFFVVDLDKDELWDKYLDSFPAGANEIYRKRREFDCSCCRHFIKNFGNIVAIKNNQVVTIWDFDAQDNKYQVVINTLAEFVKSKPITDVFVTKENSFGSESTRDLSADNSVHTWYHLYSKLPKNIKRYDNDLNAMRGNLRDIRNVFERSLNEITQDSVEAILELISQKSLYKGEEWDSVLKQFLKIQKEYKKLSTSSRTNYCWKKSIEVGPVVGKIKNHSIGALLTNISEGMDLDEAVKKYEAIVAPTNYKRPKAIFTKKMVEEAQKKIEEMGLLDSLERRHAVLDDITVNNTLFVNRNVKQKMTGNIFEEMTAEVSPIKAKSFEKLEEVSIDTFIKDILPKASSIDLFLENKHSGNMVSLIAPKNKDSKTMFKWNNNFSWAYKGNITDSMKEKVKAAGGKVDGVLRFSICWNDDENYNPNDFDAHCVEPGGNRIYFGDKMSYTSGGKLDVDIMCPEKGKPAVENITWSNRQKMRAGTYSFMVHNFSHRGGRTGFNAEIEFDGKLHQFHYGKELRSGETVAVADVEKMANGEFKIIPKLPSTSVSRDIWGLKSEQFHPVQICMYSPNYWDEQDGIGHRHYLFMLKGCVNDESPNGFFNEFLHEEFMKHKRVFESLGGRMKVAESDNQLSGVGFSATKHDTFVCRVKGTFERILKVKI